MNRESLTPAEDADIREAWVNEPYRCDEPPQWFCEQLWKYQAPKPREPSLQEIRHTSEQERKQQRLASEPRVTLIDIYNTHAWNNYTKVCLNCGITQDEYDASPCRGHKPPPQVMLVGDGTVRELTTEERQRIHEHEQVQRRQRWGGCSS